MKVLLIYMDEFAFRPGIKVIDDFPDVTEELALKDIQAAFIHAEAGDMDNESTVEKKLLKNIKWAAGKNSLSVNVSNPGVLSLSVGVEYHPEPDTPGGKGIGIGIGEAGGFGKIYDAICDGYRIALTL